jgi:anti-sigma28 factor (negative regulator of flagellin synthesis)
MDLRNSSVSAGLNPGVTGVVTGRVAGSGAAQPYGRMTQEDRAGETSALDPDWATLSAAGSQAAQTTGEGSVREDKVAAVRAALTTGTYAVPVAQVAERAVSAMLGQGA